MFIGNSRVGYGVDPSIFNDEFQSITNTSTISYNASIDGTDARLTTKFTETFLLPLAHVETLIWGIAPSDLTNNSYFSEQWHMYTTSPEVLALTNTSAFSSDRWLNDFALWDYRYDLGFIAKNFMIPDHYPSERNALGYHENFEVVDLNSFRDRSIVSLIPDTYPRTLDSEMVKAISDFLIMAKSRNIRVIAFLPPTNLEAYPDYDEYDTTWRSLSNELQSLFEANGAIFYNFDKVNNPIVYDTNDFRDSVHLNNSGASKLSKQLASLYIQCCSE